MATPMSLPQVGTMNFSRRVEKFTLPLRSTVEATASPRFLATSDMTCSIVGAAVLMSNV